MLKRVNKFGYFQIFAIYLHRILKETTEEEKKTIKINFKYYKLLNSIFKNYGKRIN